MRKLSMAESGASLAAVTVYDKDLLSLAANLVKELRWVGPFEVECIYSDRMRKYLVIEFNSRFPCIFLFFLDTILIAFLSHADIFLGYIFSIRLFIPAPFLGLGRISWLQ